MKLIKYLTKVGVAGLCGFLLFTLKLNNKPTEQPKQEPTETPIQPSNHKTMTLQPHFNAFHDKIKLDAPAGGRTLIIKREELAKYLQKEMAALGLWFSYFNQGSYEMSTGVKPIKNGDYDLDTGLQFEFTTSKYPDPTDLKKMVKQLLEKKVGGAATVTIKDPCVQVEYADCHLDFALYARHPHPQNNDPMLAWGRVGAQAENKGWVHANPKQLIRLVKEKYRTTSWKREQFIRITRYLKRWKAENFKDKTHAAPTSIALTAIIYTWLEPKRDPDGKPNDLEALYLLLDKAKRENYGSNPEKLTLPIKSRHALFDKMREGQKHIDTYQQRMGRLYDALKQARHHHHNQHNPQKAVSLLQEQFGSDFQ